MKVLQEARQAHSKGTVDSFPKITACVIPAIMKMECSLQSTDTLTDAEALINQYHKKQNLIIIVLLYVRVCSDCWKSLRPVITMCAYKI